MHSIDRAEAKHTVLQLARKHSPKEIAKMTSFSEDDVSKYIKEAIGDLEEKNEELGRAALYLELNRIEEVKRMMMGFVDEFRGLVKLSEEDGLITEQAEKAFNMVMQSADRLERYTARTSKLLGLDAPTKLQAVTDSKAPDRVVQAALDLEKVDEDDDSATFSVSDL